MTGGPKDAGTYDSQNLLGTRRRAAETTRSCLCPQALWRPGLPCLLCRLQEERALLPMLCPGSRSPGHLTETSLGPATPDLATVSISFPSSLSSALSVPSSLPEATELRQRHCGVGRGS